MAIYETDFSQYADGVTPSDWDNTQWAADSSFVVQDDVNAKIGGKVLDWTADSDSFARRVLLWDGPSNDTNNSDHEVLYLNHRVAQLGSDPNVGQCASRVSGSGGTETGLVAGWRRFSSDLIIQAAFYDGGAFTEVERQNLALASDALIWNRIVVSGNDLNVKTWLYGDDEPASFQLLTTQSNIGGTGGIGVFMGSTVVKLDYFAVATEGETLAVPTVEAASWTDVTVRVFK